MQPLEGRMRDLYTWGKLLADKQWKPWSLGDILFPLHGGHVGVSAEGRVPLDQAGLGQSIYTNLFYADAWSLLYFCWYAETGGTPKYRDRFLANMRQEFEIQFPEGSRAAATGGILRTAQDFRKAMGLEDDAAFAAFESEWRAFEADLVQKHHKPAWDEEYQSLRKRLRMDE
jgi:hypothetical protein